MSNAADFLLDNKDLGSSALLEKFIHLFSQLSTAEVFDLLSQLQATFPLMAVWSFAESYFKKYPPDQHSVTAFSKEVQQSAKGVLQRSDIALAEFDTLLTLSHSSLVEAFLCRCSSRKYRVICARSLPAGEGVSFSRALQNEGLSIDMVEDWEINDEIKYTDAIVLGADWVTSTTIINKSGSAELVKQADVLKKPVFILAEAFKFIQRKSFPEEWHYQDWSDGNGNRKIKVFESFQRTSNIQII